MPLIEIRSQFETQIIRDTNFVYKVADFMKEGYLQATIFGSIDPIDSTPIESDFNL